MQKKSIKIPNELKTIVNVFLGKCITSTPSRLQSSAEESTGRNALSKCRRKVMTAMFLYGGIVPLRMRLKTTYNDDAFAVK